MTEVVELSESLLESAAGLVVEQARSARLAEPLLAPVLEDPDSVMPLLERVNAERLAVAALDNGVLVGFLAAFAYEFWDSPVAYVPEWAFASVGTEVTTSLYREAARRWQEADRTVHTVTLWAHDPLGEAAWHHLGFGRVVVDTVGEVASAPHQGRVPVKRAGPEEAPVVARLQHDLWEYLARPPIFRIHPQPEGEGAARLRLQEPDQPVWLATGDEEVIGFLSLAPSEAPAPLTGTDIIRCDGAFVLPEHRAAGVGQSLVATAMKWAAEAGFKRLAVDYESANPDASRFWPALALRPVTYGLARRLLTTSGPFVYRHPS